MVIFHSFLYVYQRVTYLAPGFHVGVELVWGPGYPGPEDLIQKMAQMVVRNARSGLAMVH